MSREDIEQDMDIDLSDPIEKYNDDYLREKEKYPCLHILYYDKNNKFHEWSTSEFKSIKEVEKHLKLIKARDWQICVLEVRK